MPRVPVVRWPRMRIDWAALLVPPMLVGAVIVGSAPLKAMLDRPVEKLVVEGVFQRVTPPQIEALVAPDLGRGFLSLDLGEIRRRLEALPWVDHVRLRRAWPDTLIVGVTEHRAAARWGEAGLMNERGEVFAGRPPHAFPELPRLDGPDGSERDVARFYLALRAQLDAAHLEIEALALDERGAWRLTLASGQEVRFGRRDVAERAERFFRVVAPALASELGRVEYVDLRYTNGFAVGWLGDEPEAEVVARSAESQGRG